MSTTASSQSMGSLYMQKPDYTLYVCTDRHLMSSPTIEESVEKAIEGGAGIIQLREKDVSSRSFYDTAASVHRITMAHGIPLIINDRADIALAIGAEGVHVGQEDLPASVLRRMMPEGTIIGVSASTVEEAIRAEADGADYLGVGAMNPTATKADAENVTIGTLKEIRRAVCIPIVIIGGINKGTIPSYKGLGVDGIAVVSAVVAAPDPAEAARELRSLWLA